MDNLLGGDDVINGILEQVRNNQNGVIGEQQQPAEEVKERQRELVAQYRACFNNVAGRAVLADLRNRTVDQPTWTPGLANDIPVDGESARQFGFLREGQNSLYRQILIILEWEEPTWWT